jgi:hypothetical protein
LLKYPRGLQRLPGGQDEEVDLVLELGAQVGPRLRHGTGYLLAVLLGEPFLRVRHLPPRLLKPLVLAERAVDALDAEVRPEQ